MSQEDEERAAEKTANPEQVYRLTVLRPGGNDTCLVAGIVLDAVKRKQVNDAVMVAYPTVEQVGFVNLDTNAPELLMAGGEFCGNATRSTAWLALNGRPGEVAIRVSGVLGPLKAGVTADGLAYAQMPIYPERSRIYEDSNKPGNFTVEMEGITQYIDLNTEEIEGLSVEAVKAKGMDFIRRNNFDRFPAAGVMYCQKGNEGWRLSPVVYVRDIDTLFFETACGSGTTALGMVLALQQDTSIKDVPVLQPSGLPIAVSVDFDGQSFRYAQISGPLEIVVPMGSVRVPASTEREDI